MRAADWFASRGWTPHDFQREVWQACAEGRSGLLHATTGSGKTYAVWLGLLQALGDRSSPDRDSREGAGPRVVWITPMRALAADTVRALHEPLAELQPSWSVQARTGDTSSTVRARQERRWPQVLVTTPETLSLLLTRDDAAQRLSGVQAVVVDEWHELVGSKRGVQLQLALARLAVWNPALMAWGLSATLGNLQEALHTLVAPLGTTQAERAQLVRGRIDKTLVIDTLLPADPGRFSWGGHLGAQMLQPVVREIEASGTTLVFTNTRSQAEIWYQMLLQERPEWAGIVALHHGSLDAQARAWVEEGLKGGTLHAVVATSSLDLGVDFLPVERVLQVGSAKGVARLLQRAGRSGHAPGRPSRITLVPTNTLELVEAVAVRRAALEGRVEPRHGPQQPMDVLVQHLVTVALGGGFEPDALFEEVQRTPAFAGLSREAFDWALAFVERGGQSLSAYPEYHRVQRVDGRCVVADRGVARRHRMQVGTIVSDAGLTVQWLTGGKLGTIEEGFLARLSPGDCFVFAGRLLELVRIRDTVAHVRKAARPKGVVSTWAGSKMPLSTELADAVLQVFDDCADALERKGPSREAVFSQPELAAAEPMLATQAWLSKLPRQGRWLMERLRSREGDHLYLYPFAGRLVHGGLAQLLAWRLAQAAGQSADPSGGAQGNTFSLSFNDHGLEIVASRALPPSAQLRELLLTPAHPDGLLQEVMQSLQAGELPRRRFREIARVAGLVFDGLPGSRKTMRQIQASSSLFYDVFARYDPDNRLLRQAQEEVLAQELDLQRLQAVLQALQAQPWDTVELPAVSPMSLPLMVERLREQLSTEKLSVRLQRLLEEAGKRLPRS